MTHMESPKRKMQKKNDYQRHKLFRKIKRRRKAQAKADQQVAMKQLRKKLKLPKFGDGKGIKLETGAPQLFDIMIGSKIGEKFSDKIQNTKKLLELSKENHNPFNNAFTRSILYSYLPPPLENKMYPQLLQFHNSGKDIHIKKSKRGTFTKAAKQHGMSVQGFANRVLRNPSKYSAAMRKKANFARNASKWNK